jgi:hypothetical protein
MDAPSIHSTAVVAAKRYHVIGFSFFGAGLTDPETPFAHAFYLIQSWAGDVSRVTLVYMRQPAAFRLTPVKESGEILGDPGLPTLCQA